MDAPELIAEPAHDSTLNPCPCPSPMALACLRRLASSYVWWKTPEEAMQFPDRVAAQVMNLGTWDDLLDLVEASGEEYLRSILQHAEAGQFDERSWHYWHYRLGLAECGVKLVPSMPVRKTA